MKGNKGRQIFLQAFQETDKCFGTNYSTTNYVPADFATSRRGVQERALQARNDHVDCPSTTTPLDGTR